MNSNDLEKCCMPFLWWGMWHNQNLIGTRNPADTSHIWAYSTGRWKRKLHQCWGSCWRRFNQFLLELNGWEDSLSRYLGLYQKLSSSKKKRWWSLPKDSSIAGSLQTRFFTLFRVPSSDLILKFRSQGFSQHLVGEDGTVFTFLRTIKCLQIFTNSINLRKSDP